MLRIEGNEGFLIVTSSPSPRFLILSVQIKKIKDLSREFMLLRVHHRCQYYPVSLPAISGLCASVLHFSGLVNQPMIEKSKQCLSNPVVITPGKKKKIPAGNCRGIINRAMVTRVHL